MKESSRTAEVVQDGSVDALSLKRQLPGGGVLNEDGELSTSSRAGLLGIEVAPPAENERTKRPSNGEDGRSAGNVPRTLKPSGGGAFRYDENGIEARVERDGTVEFRDPPKVLRAAGAVAELLIHLEPVPMLEMLTGRDSEANYAKQKFMSKTRALRQMLCDRDREERLHEAIPELKETLQAIWMRDGTTVAAKKEALFRLWDSCSEESDPALARTSMMARAIITAFIREKLKEGGPDAYRKEELLALNSRRLSKTRFDPYSDD